MVRSYLVKGERVEEGPGGERGGGRGLDQEA